MGIDLSLSERVREREIQRQRDGERRESERGRRSPETTNTNRSLNCKHNLKETEAARFEPWPQVTAMSAPEFARMTKTRCSSSKGMMSPLGGEARGPQRRKCRNDGAEFANVELLDATSRPSLHPRTDTAVCPLLSSSSPSTWMHVQRAGLERQADGDGPSEDVN